MGVKDDAIKILIEYATAHGVRELDIVHYAERVHGKFSEKSLVEKAKRIEEFAKSPSRENSLEIYRDAVRVFGILYAATVQSDENQLEGGVLTSMYDTFFSTFLATASISVFVLWYLLNFQKKALRSGVLLILGSGENVSKYAIDAAGKTTGKIVGENIGGQAIAWTGIVTAIIASSVTIAAVLILRK